MLSEHLSGFDLYLTSETWPSFHRDLEKLCVARKEIRVLRMAVSELKQRGEELRSHKLDSVFSTNMLEHVKDDIETLRESR